MLSRDSPNISAGVERSAIVCPPKNQRQPSSAAAPGENCEQPEYNLNASKMSITAVGLYALEPIRERKVLAVRALYRRPSRAYV
jgi:hypothetical protein